MSTKPKSDKIENTNFFNNKEIRNMPTLSPEAFDRIAIWLQSSIDETEKEEIRNALDTDPHSLEDAFYTLLSFGTGGMRGIMGLGTNRMNIHTVGMATQALINYIMKVDPDSKHSVVIGYDSRINSKIFAEIAARVVAASGSTAYLFDDLRPTPEISFACRFLKASSAIMITASHNPPEYNGYKVYWSDGGQVLPPHDSGILNEFQSVSGPDQVRLSEPDSPLIQRINVDAEYLKALPKPLNPSMVLDQGKTIRILYSNLHGAGGTIMPEALKNIGIEHFAFVEAQRIPDGRFPTTKRPNPEEAQALELGRKQLILDGYDLFIATDPDADRLGAISACFRPNKEPCFMLNGNQIFALMTQYVLDTLTQQKKLPPRATVIKSIVATPLIDAICKKYHVQVVSVLPGFKYFAEKIRVWESQPESPQFILGGEESYGTLYGTHARDKDAISASRLLVEIACAARSHGKTLYDQLVALWDEYGVYKERLLTYSYPETKDGRLAMDELMKNIRLNPPSEIANKQVVLFEDLLMQKSSDQNSSRLESADLPRSNVLIFTLEDEAKVIIRPSGTEPKIKTYLMARAQDEALCDAELSHLEEALNLLLM